jgi:D-alanyl-D-alanine carboxypeptidase (penicillin-binding protein 5/6)
MKKIGIFLCIIFLGVSINVKAITSPKIIAQGAVLMDLNNGKILLQKNDHNRYAPASTTKVMTALLTLEKCKLNEKVTVGKNPPLEDGSKISLIKGEVFTVNQLLYALLLPSANDAALALAEHISGSKQAFANLMNERAKELGCKNTNFVNPNGLYDENHYTSAYDLALIASKAMKFSKFREIVSTLSYNLMPTNKQPKIRYLHNENKLLFSNVYKYSGGNGIKTGYTIKARHTYIGSATRKGITLVVVLLCDEKGYYKEAADLFDYGFKKLIKK